MAEKGSVAIDGVSLTIAKSTDDYNDRFNNTCYFRKNKYALEKKLVILLIWSVMLSHDIYIVLQSLIWRMEVLQ